MIKKLMLAVFAVCAFFEHGFSQRLSHSFGLTISVLNGTIKTDTYSSTIAFSQTNFVYFPRYNLLEMDNSSISFGMPIGIGIGIITDYDYSDAGIAFSYDIPAVLDYNIGAKSTADNEKNFGGYAGVGFGYYKVNISKSSNSDFNGATYGPMFRAGFRITSANENWNGHGVSAGMFYKIGIEKDKLRTIGFNVLYDL